MTLTANRELDAAVLEIHRADERHAQDLVDQIVTLPPRKDALAAVRCLIDHIRADAVARPDLMREVQLRRLLRDAR